MTESTHDREAIDEREAIQAEPLLVKFTTFVNEYASTKRERSLPWDDVVKLLQDVSTIYPNKAACPWIKLAVFGELRTDKNSLRHDANVLAISGIEGDYDRKVLSMADAATMLAAAGLEAFLYTSPSYTPEKPRWRVLCPTSRELPPSERARLVARLNAALGGVLAKESFPLSQSYYFGKVKGRTYETQQVRGGRYIDECEELPEVYPPGKSANGSDGEAYISDDELRADIVEGHDGKVRDALRDLAARYAESGEMTAADSIAKLRGMLEACQWRARDPKTWQERYDGVPELVKSAIAKFGDPRTLVSPQGTDSALTHGPDTEMQMATVFTKRGAGSLLFVPGMDWYTNVGPRWQRDDKLARFTLANELCRAHGGTAKRRDRTRIESSKTAAAIVTIARPDLIALPADFDRLPYELNTPDGVIDLRNGTLRRRGVGELFMHCTAVAPDSRGIGGSRFEAFLADITCGDAELANFLRVMLGATLFASNALEDHWLAFLIGSGRNGKGTLVEKCAGRAMGTYARRIPAEVLLADERGTRHPTEIANLVGARLTYASEIDEGRRWNESRLKELSGGDKLSGRFMRQDLFEFLPSHRLVIYANHRPQIKNPDPAFKARFRLVPFNASFLGMEDTSLPARLSDELPLILGWMVTGAADYWEAGRLANCAAVEGASSSYFETQATFDAWLDECCYVDASLETRAKALYQNFKLWTEGRGEGVLSMIRWGELMDRRFKWRRSNGIWWCGIGLRP